MSVFDDQRHDEFLRLFTEHEPAIRAFVRRLVPMRAAAADAEPGELGAGTVISFTPPLRRALWWAAAAAVMLGAFFMWRGGGGRGEQVAVEAVASEQAQLAERAESVRVGERLNLSHFALTSGSLSLRLPSGVLLDVAAPAEVEFVTAMRLRVVRGKFTADVGERGKGFTIETAEARVVDLGTKFGVDVSTPGRTDVVVFEGRVEVQEPKTQAGPPIANLIEGEALRLDKRQRPQRIECVFTGPRRDDWTARAEPSAVGVIADVRDNLTGTNAKRFYRVSVGGMGIGAEARHTRGRRWFPLESGALPEWPAGADVVETFAVDARNTDFQLTLTLSRPAVLFVFHDLRQPAPAWLRERFTDTGARLRRERAESLEAATASPADRPFAVWKSAPLPPGPVTLGPQREPEQTKAGLMYGVAAKAEP